MVGTIALTFGVLAGCGSDAGSSEPLSQEQLDSSVLSASDLGQGWTSTPVDDSDGSGSTPSCLQDVNGDTSNADAPKAEAAFAQGQSTALLQQVSSIGKDANSEFDKAKKALDDCQDLTFTSSGTKLSGSISPIEGFPKAGDESAGYTMSLSAEGKTIDFDLAIVRKGGSDMLLLYGGLDTPDQAQFSQYVTTAADKIGTSAKA